MTDRLTDWLTGLEDKIWRRICRRGIYINMAVCDWLACRVGVIEKGRWSNSGSSRLTSTTSPICFQPPLMKPGRTVPVASILLDNTTLPERSFLLPIIRSPHGSSYYSIGAERAITGVAGGDVWSWATPSDPAARSLRATTQCIALMRYKYQQLTGRWSIAGRAVTTWTFYPCCKTLNWTRSGRRGSYNITRKIVQIPSCILYVHTSN